MLERRLALWLAFVVISGAMRGMPQSDQGQVAVSLERQGKLAEAEAAWSALSREHPSNPEPIAHLGLLEARQEHYAEAIASTKGDGAQPRDARFALESRSRILQGWRLQAGNLELDPLLKAQPDDQRLTILIGMSHYGLDEFAAAAPYLKQAVDQRSAEPALAADFGAQLPAVKPISMRFGCVSPHHCIERGVCRGRHAGRRGAGRNERHGRRHAGVSCGQFWLIPRSRMCTSAWVICCGPRASTPRPPGVPGRDRQRSAASPGDALPGRLGNADESNATKPGRCLEKLVEIEPRQLHGTSRPGHRVCRAKAATRMRVGEFQTAVKLDAGQRECALETGATLSFHGNDRRPRLNSTKRRD